MYSHRSEYSDRRPHNDNSTRKWDVYDDRVEGSDRNYRDDRNSYHRYEGDGHSRAERVSRSREYSDSPNRMYSKDSLNREWSRKSPVKRRNTSPHWRSSETKRRRSDKKYDEDYRHRQDHEDKTYRQSPEGFSHINVSKDFKHTPPHKEDARYKNTYKDSRYRPLDEELMYKKQHDSYRPLSPHYKERGQYERSWDCSQGRTWSQDHSKESHVKSRERNDSTYGDYENQCDNRTRFRSNGSIEQYSTSTETNRQSPTVPGQKPAKGFQRFLDVLNKGVNVATLTKIVTQTSADATDRPCSPVSFTSRAEGLQPPVYAGRQQGSQQSNCHWTERRETQRLASPQAHMSFNRQMSPYCEQRREGGQSYLTPLVVESITLEPEDEHRQRQMQGVLQAIGMDLGSDELGQMSHRIQQRLYGKKNEDWGSYRGESVERDTRRTPSPSRQSRSSSSRSNMSPLTQDYLKNKDCYSAESDVTDHIQAGDFCQNSSSSSSLLDDRKCVNSSQENSAASQAFSPSPAYTVSEAPVTPVVPSYSPFPPMTPALPPVLPNLPPHIAIGISRLLLPHLPPIFPYPRIPPLNLLPGVLNPTRHLLPQQISNIRSPLFNLPVPTQPVNATQKSKTLSRPRCLQVIETNQTG
ncbi:cyclin-dependent kinase 12-like [Betta splendens]|uniref:Cyclin-dependent kinase 12-like n=1 Tax=Betta splendens TaxID=158456 RepID=A0A6P7ME36_BETSP|nr:cyclin-dependent kinase 12-like [Betta splendens]XP_029004578.1 cyclin-dependent kinase 12-like [Betta splendens]XP_029004672.1 cyclin-dependent kinase 12-like [Betta splendens]